MGRVTVLWRLKRAGVGESPDFKQTVKRTPEVAAEAGSSSRCVGRPGFIPLSRPFSVKTVEEGRHFNADQ